MVKRRDILVGMVFLGAIIGVGYLTVVIKGFSYISGPSLPPLTITFPEVLALEEGEDVRAKGVRVGQVAEVKYRNDGRVDVVVTLFKDPRLREGCSFSIRSKSALGGKYLEIDPGPPAGMPIAATAFTGERPSDLFTELGDVLGRNKENLVKLIENLRDTSQAIRDGKGTIGALIFDEAMKESLARAVHEVAAAVTGTEPKGLLHAILHDRDLADSVRDIAGDLRGALRRTDTTVGVLLNDPQTGTAVKETLANLAAVASDLRAGKGTIGRLFADDQLYAKAVALADGLGAIADGEGVIPWLIRDPESREQGRDALRNLRDVAVKLNEGDGTVARLLNKPDLYNQAQGLLVQIRESVEDAREQAPINQLVNMLGAIY